MASNFRKPSKKTEIILAATIVVLLTIAVTGTVVFLKGRGSTDAAELGDEQSFRQETADKQNSVEESVDPVEQNTQTNQNLEQTTNIGNNNNGKQANTQRIDNIKETTITRIKTVEIPEQKISEGHYVGWTPMNIKANLASANIEAHYDNITMAKIAETETGDNLAKVGEKITYKITVKNNESKDLIGIEIKDKIPAMTTYAENSADNNGTIISENGNVAGLIWNIDLKAKEQKTVSFGVIINKDATGSISNIAFANGEKSEETKTALVQISKTSQIKRNEEVVEEPARVGDEIVYTISIKNNGEVDGITTIKDEDLKNILQDQKAEMIGNVLLYENNELISNDKTLGDIINGIKNIRVPANGKIRAVFSIKLNKIEDKITNVAVIGKTPTIPDEVETTNIEIAKDVKQIVRGLDEIVEEPVKLNDIIHYEIVVSNTGSATARVNVLDQIQNSNMNLDIKDETGKVVTEIAVDGNSKRVLSATYTVTQEDINNQKDIVNVAKAIYEDDEKQDDVTTPVEKEVKDVLVEKQVRGENDKVDLTAVKKNDILVYSVKVTNNGNIAISSVVVTDTKLGIENKEYTFTVINPGESTTIELGKYTVTQEDINVQKEINNVVLVNGKKSEVNTPVEKENSKIKIQKDITAITVDNATTTFDKDVTVNEIKAQQGNTIIYLINVTNEGNTTLSNIEVTDNKNVTLVSAKLPDRLSNATISTGNKVTANNNLLGTSNITLEPNETIILIVSYLIEKVDVVGVNYQKDFVNTAYVTGYFNTKKYEDNDDATINTEYTPITGSKTFVKVWKDINYESCRPNSINIQLMNGDTKVENSVNVTSEDNWSYTWNNIPLEDTSGNTINYIATETAISGYTASACTVNGKGQLTITNTYNKPISQEGQIIKTRNLESTSEIKVPIDVVFIVDTSGSMTTDNRAKSMVNAVNSAATQILNYNSYNRVSVVGYSGKYDEGSNINDSTVLLPLDNYTAKTTSKGVNSYLKISNSIISTNVNEKINNNRYVDGGTYTQIGIKEGASQLTSSTNKSVIIDGKKVQRIPVIILLSDGEPTLYSSSYNNVTSQNRQGDGDYSSAEMGYYTILSANYYKNQVSNSYGKTAKVYTIAMDMDGLYGKSVLNPTVDNITKCASSTSKDQYGYNATKNLYSCFASSKCNAGELQWHGGMIYGNYELVQKEINVTKNPYAKYNYDNNSYAGIMDATQLEKIMKDIITEVVPQTTSWAISESEINSAKVGLPDLNVNETFALKAGTLNYNKCSDAITAGIIVENDVNEYYIDLTKVPAGVVIKVSYTSK